MSKRAHRSDALARRASAVLALAPALVLALSLGASALTVTITTPLGGLWTASDTASVAGTASGATADRLALDSDADFLGGTEINTSVAGGILQHDIPATETWRYFQSFTGMSGQSTRPDGFWMWPWNGTAWTINSAVAGVSYPPSLVHTGTSSEKNTLIAVLPGPLVSGSLAFSYLCQANGELTVSVSSDGRMANESSVLASSGGAPETPFSFNLTTPLSGARALYVRIVAGASAATNTACSLDDFDIVAEYTKSASSAHRFFDDFTNGTANDEHTPWALAGSGWLVGGNPTASDTPPALVHFVPANTSVTAEWGFATSLSAGSLSFHYQCEVNGSFSAFAGNSSVENTLVFSASGPAHTVYSLNLATYFPGTRDFHVRFQSNSGPLNGTCGVDDFSLNLTLTGNLGLTYTGSYTSAVIDLGQASNLTALDWNGSVPAGTTRAMSFRASTNNISFSAWGPVATSGQVPNPASGRYTQFRLDFSSTPGLLNATVDRVGLNFSGVERVEVSVNGAAWSPASGTSSWSASVLLVGGSNNITVRATDSTGATVTSVVEVLRDTFPPSAPGTPQAPAVANITEATWTWGPATDTGLGIDHYIADVGLTPNGAELGADVAVTGTSYTATGLPDNQRVYLTVRAFDLAGLEGPASPPSAGTLIDRTPPGPVSITGPGAYTTNSTLTWTWSIAQDFGSGVSAYLVRLGHVPGTADIASASTTATTFTYPQGVSGETYFLSVSALDGAQNEGPVTPSSGTTIDTTAPVGPLTASSPPALTNLSSLTWSWSAATDALSGVDHYLVSIGTSPGASDVVSASWFQTSYSISFVPAGARYYFEVRAVDRAGNIGVAYTAPPVLVDDAAPTAPALDPVAAFVGNLSQAISWDPSTDQPATNASGIDHYLVRVSAGSAVNETSVSSLTFTLTLADGVHYTVAVAAVDRAGNEGASASLAFTADQTGPVPPTSLRVVVSDASGPSLTATWNGTSDAGAGLKEYHIQVGTTPGGSDVVGESTVSGTTYSWTGRFDTPYYVTVWGVDNLGNAGAKASTGAPVTATKPSTGGGFLPGPSAALVLLALAGGALAVAARRRSDE
ncbi:MAG TPA: hypothetical protein VJ547_12340 [Candidatus Thermoplasmatota archaeon]|nr:hypothetical protein [Candidatus Thermoplasmatota archaeon]